MGMSHIQIIFVSKMLTAEQTIKYKPEASFTGDAEGTHTYHYYYQRHASAYYRGPMVSIRCHSLNTMQWYKLDAMASA